MSEIVAVIKMIPVFISAIRDLLSLFKEMNIEMVKKEIEHAKEAQKNATNSKERIDAAIKLMDSFRGK